MSARRIPIGLSVGLIRAALPIARTWRFRHPDDPTTPFRPILGAGVHACWHEHLLPLTWLFAGQGVATMASRDRDGEIVTRLLHRLGYVVARGSSTRGGATAFRELTRAAGAGHAVIVTADGPRGPRRSLKEGAVRLAAHVERPIVPVALASSAGWRLRSWDRFLIPAPGATVFVLLGDETDEDLSNHRPVEVRLARQIARCEQAAAEGRWARPPRVRRLAVRSGPVARGATASVEAASEGDRAPTATRGAPAADARHARTVTRRRSGGALEGWLRARWSRPRPSAALRPAAAAFALAHDGRRRLYELGVFAVHRAGLPVISVGGATVGGSAKTPIASAIARTLAAGGHTVAILTRGYPDELGMHARTCPDARVLGHPDRVRIARRTAAAGATVAVLDDGYQHRRLHRDLDLLLIDRDALRRTNRARLPAGPFRENWEGAAGRADGIVITGRERWTDELARFDETLRGRLSDRRPTVAVASVVLEPGPIEAANDAARAWAGPPEPGLALTGIMKPNLFFDHAAAGCESITVELALKDHGVPTSRDRGGLVDAAGPGGVLTTLKDLSRIEGLLEDTVPIWIVPETIAWRAGWEDLRRSLFDAAPTPNGDGKGLKG